MTATATHQPTPDPSASYAWMAIAIDLISSKISFTTDILGVVGNALSFFITTKRDNRKNSTCIFMAALALVDTGVLLIGIFFRALASHKLVEGLEGNMAFLSIVMYGTNAFSIVSGLFLAEMSVDRTIAVVQPIRAQTICTSSRAVKVTVSTFVIGMMVHIQSFFIYKMPDPPNGALLVDFPQARWFEVFFNTYRLILGTALPFSIIIVCNITIIFSIRKAAKNRQKMSLSEKKGKSEANLTKILLLTSFAYLVCSCPMRIYDSFVHYDLSDPYWSTRYWLQWWACAELWRVNFAINFYLYFLGGGKKFRDDAKQMFVKCGACYR